MGPTDRYKKTRDPRELAVYPMSRERNQALQDLVATYERTRACIVATKLVLICLHELREDLQRSEHPAFASEDSIQRAKSVLLALIELLAQVDKAEEAQDAANAPTEPPKEGG